MYEPLDPEETPKGVALAALKEIEFDRETGKLSDADYEFLKAKYTGQALEAMRAEKAAVTVGDVEAMIAARVQDPSLRCGPGAALLLHCMLHKPALHAVHVRSPTRCSARLAGAGFRWPGYAPDAVPPSARTAHFCEQCGARVAA